MDIAARKTIEVRQLDGNTVRLGWMTIFPPCTRLESDGPTLRIAEQRAYVDATVDSSLLATASRDCLDCLEFAIKVAGLVAVITAGEGAAGAFETAFKHCLAQKHVDEKLSRAVSLTTGTECMW